MALLVVISAPLSVFAITIWLLAPSVVNQAEDLAIQLPQAVNTLKEKAASYHAMQRVMNSAAWQQISDPQGSQILCHLRFASGTLSALLSIVLVAFIGFYLAFEPTVYTNGILRLVPKRRDYAVQILGSIGYTLRRWMIAQFIDMWIIGTATAIGLWLLGVRLALVFGILAGLFNIIPNFGPLVSLIPATLIVLMHSPQTALYVIVLYIILQSLEGYGLMPLLHARRSICRPC